MSLISVQDIEVLQAKVRQAIMDADPNKALDALLAALPPGRAKHNQVLVLKSRQAEILRHTIGNTLSEDQLSILRNNLTADTLLFNDHLTLEDFAPAAAHRPELRPGHLLYRIPTSMVVAQTYDCLIRVAHELAQVMQGIASEEDVVVEEISLAEVMEVEILDPGSSSGPAFNITLLSDGEQFVDEYSYTEWVFNVRPLVAGSHQVILKISVLLTVNGKERTKNVVLRRPVTVVADAVEAAAPALMRRLVTTGPLEEVAEAAETPRPPKVAPSDLEVVQPYRENPPLPPPIPVPSAPAPQRRKKPAGLRFLSIAATLLLLAVTAIWVMQPNYISVGGTEGDSEDNKNKLDEDSLRNLFPRDTADIPRSRLDSL